MSTIHDHVAVRSPDLDDKVVVALATKVGLPVKEHLALMGGNVRVFETLNALAAVTALVLRGTGRDPRAIDFYTEALRNNLNQEDEPMPMTDADRDMLVQRASDTIMSYAGTHSKEDATKYLEAVVVKLQSNIEGMKAPEPTADAAQKPAEEHRGAGPGRRG